MATNYLNVFAESNDFTYHNSKIFGEYNGYEVCVAKKGDKFKYYFTTKIEELSAFTDTLNRNFVEYKIVGFSCNTPQYCVVCESKDIVKTLDFLTSLLSMCGASDSHTCPFCGESLSEPSYYDIDGVVCSGHDSCLDKYNYLVNKQHIDRKNSQVKASKAFLPSLLLGLIGCVVMVGIYSFLSWELKIYYVIGSVLVGFLCALGYTRKNGKNGVKMYLTCLVSSVLCEMITILAVNAVSIVSRQGASGDAMLFFSNLFAVESVKQYAIELVYGLALAVLGAFVLDVERIYYYVKNTVKITKI